MEKIEYNIFSLHISFKIYLPVRELTTYSRFTYAECQVELTQLSSY